MANSKEQNNKVSVIIPIYNCESFLERCLDSIIHQTYKDIEIILVNDGSKDKSGEICKKYQNIDKRVKYYVKENGGPASARNLGINLSTGGFLMFIDSDDFLELSCIQNAVSCMINNSVEMVVFNWRKHYSDGSISVSNIGNSGKHESQIIRKVIIKDDELFGGGYPWNRIVRKIDCFPLFDERLFAYEDKYWTIQYLEKIQKVYIADFIGYNYIDNPNSLSNNVLPKRLSNTLLFCKLVREEYAGNGDLDDDIEMHLSGWEVILLWEIGKQLSWKYDDLTIYNVPHYRNIKHIKVFLKSLVLRVLLSNTRKV